MAKRSLSTGWIRLFQLIEAPAHGSVLEYQTAFFALQLCDLELDPPVLVHRGQQLALQTVNATLPVVVKLFPCLELLLKIPALNLHCHILVPVEVAPALVLPKPLTNEVHLVLEHCVFGLQVPPALFPHLSPPCAPLVSGGIL